MHDDSYKDQNTADTPDQEPSAASDASAAPAEPSSENPGAEHAPLPLFLQEDHLTPLLEQKNALRPDDRGPVPAPLEDADEPSDIPWRGMPSLASDERLYPGVLQGDDSGELAGACPSYDEDQQLIFDEDCGGECPDDEDDAPRADTELVLGVKFRQYGPVYFFRAGQEKVRAGGKVLAETEQGLSLATVISTRRMRLPLPKLRTVDGEEMEIKSILGLAGPEDIAAAADNQILASTARLYCKECIRKRDLDMKLVDVEVLHDRSKIIFYFTAPTRIDFRDLVKDLVRNYRTRIELRQIGVRHETQMIGALGNCGMTCCCRRYLRRFAPVTIKMAKEQNLFLNPAKLSGICGRLLCCLSYEQENYDEFHRKSPKLGKKYQTKNGMVRVLRANLFRQSIVVLDESGNETEMQLDEWQDMQPTRLEQNAAPQGGSSGPGARSGSRQRRDSPKDQDKPGSGPEREQADRNGKPAQDRPDAGEGKRRGAPARLQAGQPEQPLPEPEPEAAPADDRDFSKHSSGRVYPPGFRTDDAYLRDDGEELLKELEDEPEDGSIFGLPGTRFNKGKNTKN